MIAKAVPEFSQKALIYSKESNELQLIFIAIIKKSKTHSE